MCSGYENLEDRKEVRENAWSRPGWDQCVSRTGEMHSVYTGTGLGVCETRDLVLRRITDVQMEC